MTQSIQHIAKEDVRKAGYSSFTYQLAERGSNPANLIGWDLTCAQALRT